MHIVLQRGSSRVLFRVSDRGGWVSQGFGLRTFLHGDLGAVLSKMPRAPHPIPQTMTPKRSVMAPVFEQNTSNPILRPVLEAVLAGRVPLSKALQVPGKAPYIPHSKPRVMQRKRLYC